MTTNKRNIKKDVGEIKEMYDALNTLAVRVKMIESENVEMRRIIMSLEHKISSK